MTLKLTKKEIHKASIALFNDHADFLNMSALCSDYVN